MPASITAVVLASSLLVSAESGVVAGASQKADETTTTTTAPPTTTTSAAPATTTTSTTAPYAPHDAAWAQLTASRGKLAESRFPNFQVVHFDSALIPPGSPIAYSNSDGQIAVKVTGYYQVSFSVYAERSPSNYVDQVTEWGLGVYGRDKNLSPAPLPQCSAPSNWFPFPSRDGDVEQYSYVTARTCIVQLESKYTYGLLKLSQGEMNLKLPINLNGVNGGALFASPASLTINLLDATP
jgi:hypothetical protein